MPNQSPLKNLSKEDGFTLIEVLVAINVAFIGLTVIITFYLFMSKFIFSSGKKIETSQMIYDSFYKIDGLLKRYDEFSIQFSEDSVFVLAEEKRQVIFLADKIIVGDIYTLVDLDTVRVLGNWSSAISHRTEIEEFSSKDINGFRIEIEKDEKIYSWQYNVPAVSVNKFTNKR